MSDEQTRDPLEDVPDELGVLPLRNSVLFPGVIIPLAVGRPKSVALLEEAVAQEWPIAILTQHEAETDDPTGDQMYRIGTAARIVKVIKLSDDNYSVIVQGLGRIRLKRWIRLAPYHFAEFDILRGEQVQDVEVDALFFNLKQTAKDVLQMMPEVPKEASVMLDDIAEPGQLADLIASNLDVPTSEKQSVLETIDVKDRLKLVLTLITRQLEVLKVSDKIHTQVKEEIDRNQREYYLRQQLKAIKEELGEIEGDPSDLEELLEKIKQAEMPEEAEKVALKQYQRLKMMQPASSEYMVTRTYTETLAELPWNKSTEDNLDIPRVREILDEDHYDLDKVKKRVVEYLAVRKLKADMRGPILCFVGPPGVGKTSLGRSIARSIDREFLRNSLGGIHDEAEIRGHRRTYVGSLPGRIIQGLKKVGTNNPVFMLDEIDKIGRDFRGDPAAALLEVLDPEQNNAFSDHYLEVPFDLSKVMFIATANMLDPVPPALKDRMEVLELPGYTRNEKLQIAREFLVPKQLDEHGLTDDYLEFADDAIFRIIDYYTREAGVRNLERTIASVCRGVAVDVAEDKHEERPRLIGEDHLADFLGPEKFLPEAAERTEVAGVATGLAWTSTGGDLLFVEATRMPGKGSLVLTGQLGDVMKESAQAALSYVRTHASRMGIPEQFLKDHDVHVHVPAGAIPKDGPSAGVAILAALVSMLTGKRICGDLAMTGEITLRGSVLPVGGVKEKVLAAHRAELNRVILPERNQKDMVEIPEEIRNDLEFVFISRIDDLLPAALEGFEMVEEEEVPAKADGEGKRKKDKPKRRTPRPRAAPSA